MNKLFNNYKMSNEVKIAFIGDKKVGKTKLIKDFISNSTKGIDLNSNKIEFLRKIDGREYKAYFYKFDSCDETILNNLQQCMTVVLMFDLENRESFENLEKWIEFLIKNYKSDYSSENKEIYICGNYKLGNNLTADKDEIVTLMSYKYIDAEYIDIGIKNLEEKNKLLDELIITTYPRMNLKID